MPFRLPSNSPDLSRLQGYLVQSKMQTENNPLFQTINLLISWAQLTQGTLEGRLIGTITNLGDLITLVEQLIAAQYLTSDDASAVLPNSRELLAGTNINFNDAIPNERTINVPDSASPNATFITEDDESSDLPNSRQILAGTNITLDVSVANELTINASGSAPSEYDNGSSGSSKTIDWNNGFQQRITMTAACTFTFSNPTVGAAYRLIIIQDGTGGWTITWPASVKWENNTAPVLDTTLSTIAFSSFVYTAAGSDGYLGFATLLPIPIP